MQIFTISDVISMILLANKTISQLFVMVFDALWQNLGENIPLLFTAGNKLIPVLSIIGATYMIIRLAPTRKLDFVKSVISR